MSQSVDEMPAVVQVVQKKQLFNQYISTINMTSLVADVQKQNNHKQLKWTAYQIVERSDNKNFKASVFVLFWS